MRTRFLTSYPVALLAFVHFGCGEAPVETGERVATEESALSSNISWTSSAQLVAPQNANYASVKDPTVVYHNGKYHVYATVYNTQNTWQMVYFNFTDWSQAGSATQNPLNTLTGFSGYNCAPELFYFPPHNKWYLIYQSQPPRYSTADDPGAWTTWTAPQNMFTTTPSGMPSLPIDYYVICDDTNCHMFFTGDDGKLYRTQTAIGNFPNGWGSVSVVMTYPTSILFEGSSHYKILGENTYLTVIEGMGASGRWFAAWTATNLAGPWTAFKTSESAPWAGYNNVSFPGGRWSNDISHGEMIRYQNDHKSILDPANLQFLYQGRDPASGGAYELLPYRLGVLTAVGATGGPPGGVPGGGLGSAVYLEAECGTTEVGGYATNSTSKSGYSGSGHLMSVGNTAAMTYDGTSTDRATYNFTAPAGTYTPYFRLDTDGDANNDSWFYRVNGGAWTMVNGVSGTTTNWAWVAGTGGNVTLSGAASIEIANREDGLGIDKIALVPAGTAPPTGTGGIATNCGGGITGLHKLKPVYATSMCLEPAANSNSGARGQLWNCVQSINPNWNIVEVSTGVYELRAANGGLCLTVWGNNYTNGTDTGLYACTGQAGSRFSVTPQGSNYQFRSIDNTNKCIDVSNGGSSNGTRVQIWDCSGPGTNQTFQVAAP